VTLAFALGLKIPDNAAYTALVALRRLGVNVARVERNEILFFEDDSDAAEVTRRIVADESIFNPNKHRLTLLDQPLPRSGEVWIEPLARAAGEPTAVAWRLFDAGGAPAAHAVVLAASERLLCNPAIDRAVTRDHRNDRDIPIGSE
jgi:phosphoribosylformylglycinamidine (FGAM) synthase PurS component